LGEAIISRRGGAISSKGYQVVNIFTQLTEPTAQNIGDIWIVTDKPISNIIFRNTEPVNPSNMQGLIKVTDSELGINIQKSMEFIGLSDDYVVVSYPDLETLNVASQDKVKIWTNSYMDLFVRLGVVKYWDNENEKWVYNKAYFWNGEEWIRFSTNDYYPILVYASTGGPYLYKYNPEGELVWARSDSSAWGYSMVKDPQGNIYLGKSQRQITKLDPEGNHIWTVQVNFPNVSVDNPTCYAIEVDSDGNIYAGFHDASTIWNYITKLDTNGNVLWPKKSFYGAAIRLVLGSDGYLYFSPQDDCIYKYDLDGKSIASRDIPYVVRDMAADNHDNIYIISSQNGAVVQLDSNLNIIWSRTPVSGSVSTPKITCSQQYVYCLGADSNDSRVIIYFYKYDLNGNQIIATTKTISGKYINPTTNFAIDPDECLYLAYSGSVSNRQVLKMDDEFNIIWQIQPRDAVCNAIAVYPKLGALPYLW